MEQIADQIGAKSLSWEQIEMDTTQCQIQLVIQSIKERGIKRFVRQIFSLNGEVIFKKGRVKHLILNPLYPLINRFRTAFEVLLKPYDIEVSLAGT